MKFHLVELKKPTRKVGGKMNRINDLLGTCLIVTTDIESGSSVSLTDIFLLSPTTLSTLIEVTCFYKSERSSRRCNIIGKRMNYTEKHSIVDGRFISSECSSLSLNRLIVSEYLQRYALFVNQWNTQKSLLPEEIVNELKD